MSGLVSPETVPAPKVSAPEYRLPFGAVDTHTHIFGPFDHFAPSEPSVYALPDAPFAVHRAMMDQMGVTGSVLTQPAPYGNDPTLLLDAVRRSEGRLRAVAVTNASVGEAQLEDWARGGILGLRFVEKRTPDGGPYPGSVGLDALSTLAPAMRSLGMQAQLWADASVVIANLPLLRSCRLPVVLDHFGGIDPAGAGEADFAKLVEISEEGWLWIKLTLCRYVAAASEYEILRPFHDRLVERVPGQLLWGSDWPYVRMNPAPDAGLMIDRFAQWVGEGDERELILVDNPQRLYGFDFKEVYAR